MGLVERLTDGESDPTSAFGRALAMRTSREEVFPEHSSAERPGSTPLPQPEEGIAPGAALRSLLKELQTHRQFGITTPSHLFSLLHRHLAVERGAFLVPHRDGSMVPIATAGIDKTSAFRIHLSREELSWIGEGTAAVILDDDRRHILQARLSRNDRRHAPRIALFPFTHLRSIVAVLVVLDSPVLRMDPNVLDVIVGALSESAGRLLFDGRQRPMDHRRKSPVFDTHHRESIIRRLHSSTAPSGNAPTISVITVDLQPLVSAILQVHRHLDPARLQEDLLETIALVAESAHTVIRTGTTRVDLVGVDQPDASPQLIVFHLTVTLSALFGTPIREPLPFTVET